jgi:hypothetical protein
MARYDSNWFSSNSCFCSNAVCRQSHLWMVPLPIHEGKYHWAVLSLHGPRPAGHHHAGSTAHIDMAGPACLSRCSFLQPLVSILVHKLLGDALDRLAGRSTQKIAERMVKLGTHILTALQTPHCSMKVCLLSVGGSAFVCIQLKAGSTAPSARSSRDSRLITSDLSGSAQRTTVVGHDAITAELKAM